MLVSLKRVTSICYASSLLSFGSNYCVRNNFFQLRRLKLGVNCMNDDVEESAVKKKKKKTERIPEITLINTDGSMTVTILEQAQKLAKRYDLHLIKMPDMDTRSSRFIYKLVDHAAYISHHLTDDKDKSTSRNQSKEKTKRKSTKKFVIASKIDQHDLDTKLNNINKLLIRGCIIKIIVMYSEKNQTQEKILQHIKKTVQGVLSVEKKVGNNIMLTYNSSEGEDSSNTETEAMEV